MKFEILPQRLRDNFCSKQCVDSPPEIWTLRRGILCRDNIQMGDIMGDSNARVGNEENRGMGNMGTRNLIEIG